VGSLRIILVDEPKWGASIGESEDCGSKSWREVDVAVVAPH